jgi:hypothetical protein
MHLLEREKNNKNWWQTTRKMLCQKGEGISIFLVVWENKNKIERKLKEKHQWSLTETRCKSVVKMHCVFAFQILGESDTVNCRLTFERRVKSNNDFRAEGE